MNPFKTGDKVVCLANGGWIEEVGKVYTVHRPHNHGYIVLEEFLKTHPNHNRAVDRYRAAIAGQDYPASGGTKATNPKEAIGASKLAMHLVPTSAIAHLATAFFEGASKYGAYNWRFAGVRASTYIAAAQRHIGKWWNGDDKDPKTTVHHLANAMACLAIVIDAEVHKMLNDDRPPKQDLEALMDSLAGVQAHLADMHKGMNPTHYTEAEHGNANKA